MSARPMLQLSGAVLVAGIVFGVGVRISQWLVPAPAVRIALCDSTDVSAECIEVDGTDVGHPAGLLEQDALPPPNPNAQSI